MEPLPLLSWGFPAGSYGQVSACSVGDLRLSPGKGMATHSSILGASLVNETVKSLPVMRETLVQSLGRDDPPENGMAPHSRILAWRIPWTEEPGGLPSRGPKEWTVHRPQSAGHDWVTNTVTCTSPSHLFGETNAVA